jgi:hypothetical protein
MKYIKSSEEYSINEELELKIGWKQIIIGLCIFAAYKNYFPDKKKITLSEMNRIVADVDSKPTVQERIIIDKIKNSLVTDINQETGISEDKKKKLLNGINTIPFIMVDAETIGFITGNENTLGCYFGYMDKVRNKLITVILVDRSRVKGVSFSETLLHELRHLVDDLLTDGRKEYSELSNIVDILDKDIVVRNKEGERKLRRKINDFVDIMVKKTVNPKKLNLPEVKQLSKDIKEDYFNIIFLDKKDMDYLTSSAEIYARFHGLKRWMIKNGYLKDINSEITQDIIINMMQNKQFFDPKIINRDFFQLLFYMDVDFTGKTKSDMTKANSIVANYTDYLNKPNV